VVSFPISFPIVRTPQQWVLGDLCPVADLGENSPVAAKVSSQSMLRSPELKSRIASDPCGGIWPVSIRDSVRFVWL
jgi:hypothetical protein